MNVSHADLTATTTNSNPLNGLPCETIVYRAALDPTWFASDGQVDAAAFYRRRGEDGISIGVTPSDCRAFLADPIDGIISVHVGHVRDVRDPELVTRLDVIIDEHPHGIIANVPPKERKGPRRRLADRVASLLAKEAARPYEVFDPPR